MTLEQLGERHNIIMGKQFIDALLAAGIVRVEDMVSRVVIDVRADRTIKLFIERHADDRILKLTQDLEGVGITWAPKDAS